MAIKQVSIGPDGRPANAVPFTETAKKPLAKKANRETQQKTLEREANAAAWDRIAKAAHEFSQYHLQQGKSEGASMAEICAAILLENFNVREFFPKDIGGVEAYDNAAGTVNAWYASKTHKKVPEGSNGSAARINKKEPQTTNTLEAPDNITIEFSKDEWQTIGVLATDFNKYHLLYGTERALSETELASAMFLECLNLSDNFPEALGGPVGYSSLAHTVHIWFQAQKNK